MHFSYEFDDFILYRKKMSPVTKSQMIDSATRRNTALKESAGIYFMSHNINQWHFFIYIFDGCGGSDHKIMEFQVLIIY